MSAIPATFSLPDDDTIAHWTGHTPLTHWALLSVSGPDAASFLHGQLSQDVLNLPPGPWRRAAFCSAKGRMLADLLIWREGPERLLALVGADIAEAVHKRLSMFVLRAKAKVALHPAAVITAHFGAGPHAVEPGTVQARATGGEGFVQQLGLEAVRGCPRQLTVASGADALGEAGAPPANDDARARWRWLEVMAAVPRIESATVDQFVPQMVNFESLGGVNFRKGCYPGQEVVARSQYRGTLKRRAFLVHAASPLVAGQDVFDTRDPGQPAGVVVNAAAVPAPGHGFSALLALKTAAADGPLRLGGVEGPALTLDTLPYALFDPTE